MIVVADEPPSTASGVEVGPLFVTWPEAYALAELCKRIGWAEVRSNAIDDAEARRMLAATEVIRAALERSGVSVR